MLTSQKSKIGVNSQEFAKQYLLNHLDNNRLVFHPKGRNGRLISNLAFSDGVAVSSFTLDVKKLGKEGNPFLLPSEEKGVSYFRPVIVIDDLALKADNTLDKALVIEMLNKASVEDLIDTIESLKAQANNVTDQEGNKIC